MVCASGRMVAVVGRVDPPLPQLKVCTWV